MKRKEISALIVSARQLEEKKQKNVDKLMNYLEGKIDVFLDDIPIYCFEDADSLKDAILCYINYGEGDLSCLLDDIENALEEHKIFKE